MGGSGAVRVSGGVRVKAAGWAGQLWPVSASWAEWPRERGLCPFFCLLFCLLLFLIFFSILFLVSFTFSFIKITTSAQICIYHQTTVRLILNP